MAKRGSVGLRSGAGERRAHSSLYMNRSSPMTLRVRFSRRCQSAHGRGKPTVSTVSLAKECALRCWQTCAHAARTVGGGDGGQQGPRVLPALGSSFKSSRRARTASLPAGDKKEYRTCGRTESVRRTRECGWQVSAAQASPATRYQQARCPGADRGVADVNIQEGAEAQVHLAGGAAAGVSRARQGGRRSC